MANVRKKISELTALTSASLDTVVVGVDNGTTYKIELDVLADAVTSRVNILDRDRLQSLESVTSSFETKGRNIISSSAQITNLGFISTSVDITSLNSFTSSQSTLNTAFTNGISSRLTTSSFESFSSSIHSEILAATNEQSFNGLVSGSSQFTSSYDERYVLSGSITQTTWDNIENKPNDIISSSTQISDLGFISSSHTDITSLNSFTSSQSTLNTAFTNGISARLQTSSFNDYTSSQEITNENLNDDINILYDTKLNTSSFNDYTSSLATTGSNTFEGNQEVNGWINTTDYIITDDVLYTNAIEENTTNGGITFVAGGFGFAFNNNIEVTGSLNVSGLLIDGVSYDAHLVSTSSFNSFTSSQEITNENLNDDINILYDTKLNTSSFNEFTSSQEITNANVNDDINILYDTKLNTSSFNDYTSSLATTGSNTFIGTETISGSLLLSGSFSYNGTPLQNGFAFAQPKLTKILNNASYTAGASWEGTYVSSGGAIIVSADVTGYRASVGTGTATLYRDGVAVASHSFFFNQANVHTTLPTLTYVSNAETGSHIYAIGFTNIVADTNDYLTITVLEYGNSAMFPTTIISGSSQLTSSFDTRYTLSGSVQPLPNGLISGSSQLTSSYDTRYTLSGSVQPLPDGVVSGSSQLTASFDTRYALSGSGGGTIPAGTVSGSSQLTSSLDLRYLVTGSVTSSILQLNTFTASNANTSLNTFTSSLNIWSSSLATTGSNSFNGNQTITGSLNVSSVAVISSSFTANSSSLTLNSGSNFYLQNNGIAEISGSLRVSGSLALTGSISISSGSITMPNRPAFRVYGLGGATTATTILSGSMTIVDYNQGGWDNTTGTFTAPIAGLYQVNLVCRTNSNSSAQSVQVIVYKNNTTTSPSPNGTAQVMVEWAANTTTNHIGGSTISRLAVGDTLKAIVTVGTASFDVNDNFSVAYIG